MSHGAEGGMRSWFIPLGTALVGFGLGTVVLVLAAFCSEATVRFAAWAAARHGDLFIGIGIGAACIVLGVVMLWMADPGREQ